MRGSSNTGVHKTDQAVPRGVLPLLFASMAIFVLTWITLSIFAAAADL